MKKIAKNLTITLLVLLTIVAFFVALNYGIGKQEIVTCRDLKAQAVEFADNGVFYITSTERDMCADHNIHINAPVGSPLEQAGE